MNAEYDDPDGLRARSEQAIGELAQALIDNRLRSLSQRLEEVEDQVDRVVRDLGEVRRTLAAEKRAKDED